MQKSHETDLADFHRFISIRLEVGDPAMTPEEALDLWRTQNPSRADFEETTAALQEAIREIETGATGIPLEDFDREFRDSRGIHSEA